MTSMPPLLAFAGVVTLGAMSPEPAFTGRTGQGKWSAFREGLLCNALHPKAAMFFVALMPQFLAPGATIADVAALSAVALIITTLWFLAVATLVGTLRRVLSRMSVRRAIDALSGTVLIALGVRLAVAGSR